MMCCCEYGPRCLHVKVVFLTFKFRFLLQVVPLKAVSSSSGQAASLYLKVCHLFGATKLSIIRNKITTLSWMALCKTVTVKQSITHHTVEILLGVIVLDVMVPSIV